MADQRQLDILNQGVSSWNQYRETHPDITINLQGADLARAALHGVNLRGANLRSADLSRAQLQGANLRRANLYGANLLGADCSEAFLFGVNLRVATCIGTIFVGANLRVTNLTGAHLRGVVLRGTDLTEAILVDADLAGAHLQSTTLASVNLSHTKGLEACLHHGPSMIDMRTLQLSWPLPLPFLQGCGLEDTYIAQIPSLVGASKPSCFISYATDDEGIARRLYDDLQAEGIRSWLAPGDVKPTGRLHARIQDAIRGRDKLLLILSQSSLSRSWPQTEIKAALEAEVQRMETVLIPICVDRSPQETSQRWIRNVLQQHRAQCFCHWNEARAYDQAFKRLVQQLTNGRQPAHDP